MGRKRYMKGILSFVGASILFGVLGGVIQAQKLDKGVGPYGEFWKPIPTQRYWAPDYFYSPPEEPKGIYTADECTLCHKALNPGLVKAWAESSHANLDKLQGYQKEKLAEIEKNLGRKLTKVGCIDCHGKVGAEKLDHAKELVMTSSTLCGECHKQEYEEFESEKQYGIPDWKPGRESHAKSYDANLDVDVWAATDKNVVQGCDMCHNIQHKCDSCHTRHAFKASESRRPEACQTCHNGPDHPDIEYYRDSKHGSIYFIEGHTWDWSKQLKDANYISPTCQSCHMYYKGQYSHNMVRKAIMGEGDVLFYDNIFKGIKPTDYIKNSKELMSRREAWIEVCVKCHSPRFSRDYLDSMDKASDSIFQYVSDAYATIKSLYEEGALYPMPENRPRAPAPVTEKYPDLLGGFYGEFWAKDGNPSRIEKDFLYMWENDAFLVRKGLAHMNPNGFTYISWSNLLKKYVDIKSEANTCGGWLHWKRRECGLGSKRKTNSICVYFVINH